MQEISQALRNAIDNGNPQRVLFIFKQDAEFSAEFTNEDISITSGLKYAMYFNSETDLTIGLCPSAEIQFTMLNDADQVTDFTFGEFTAYLGAAIYEGTPTETVQRTYEEDGKNVLYAFSPLGVFIARRPDVVKKKLIDVTANDRMTLFDEEMPPASAFTQPYTPLSILQRLCNMKGVQLASTDFLNAQDITLTKWPDAFENATMREVIGMIAQAACSNAMFNRNGQLELVWFRQTNRTFNEHDYTEFTTTWYETASITGLHIRNEDSTTELKLGTDENSYLIQSNPFLRSTYQS